MLKLNSGAVFFKTRVGSIRLEYLDAADNPVSDLSPLAGMGALSYLDLRNGRLNDVSVLSGLAALTDLYLQSTAMG